MITPKFIAVTVPGLMAAVLLSVAAGTPAAPNDAIGTVRSSSGDVQIERSGQHVAAVPGMAVRQVDRIVTGRGGAVSLSFADASVLSAGPYTVLVLNQYRFDPQTGRGNFYVSLKRGALSAIAGRLVEQSPGSMLVRTPTALLAVRGTEFVARVDGAGR